MKIFPELLLLRGSRAQRAKAVIATQPHLTSAAELSREGEGAESEQQQCSPPGSTAAQKQSFWAHLARLHDQLVISEFTTYAQ